MRIHIAQAVIALVLSFSAKAQFFSHSCPDADNLQRVDGKVECLAMKLFGEPKTGTAKTLLIFLHGDTSAGGPSSYLYPLAAKYASQSVLSVALIRPGYFDLDHNESTGNTLGRRDNITEHNVEAVANALLALRLHYKVARLVIVGHSGGAATAAVILGKYPGVIDDAILVGCPCNMAQYRAGRSFRSLSPDQFVAGVPKQAKVIALTGNKDDNTYPQLAAGYIADLAARGVDGKFIEVPDANHNKGILGTEVFDQALLPLLH
jgi:pimeloyl-ACP methyl ester carboxylesterase